MEPLGLHLSVRLHKGPCPVVGMAGEPRSHTLATSIFVARIGERSILGIDDIGVVRMGFGGTTDT